MSIEANALQRAASQAYRAASYADAAQSIEVPRLFGRSAAVDEVRAALGNASEWADSALAELERSSIATPDAADAVAMLKTRVDAVRWEKDAARVADMPEMSAAVADARRAAASIELVADGTASLERGTASEWFEGLFARGSDADLEAARAVAAHPGSGMSPSVRHFVDAASSGDLHSRELAAIAVRDGAPAAASKRLDELILGGSYDVTADADELRQLLIALDDGVGDGARRLPHFLDGQTGAISLDLTDQYGVDILQRLPDRATLREEALELMAQPLDESAEQLEYLAAIESLPASIRPEIGTSTVGGMSLADAIRADEFGVDQLAAIWARTHHQGGTLGDELSRVLSQHADDDRQTARQVAALAAEDPDTVYAGLGASKWRTAHLDRLANPSSERETWRDLQVLRLLRGDEPIAGEVTAARLLDAPSRSFDDLDTLGVLAALPKSHRPASVSAHRAAIDEAFLADRPDLLDEVAWKRRVATWKQDPAAGRAALAAELEALAAKPATEIDASDLTQLARIAKAPKSLRPELPARVTDYTWADLAEGSYLPSSDTDAAQEFSNLAGFFAARRIDDDVALTPELLGRQLDDILAKPTEELSSEDVQFLASLRHVRSGKAGSLPGVAPGSGLTTYVGWTGGDLLESFSALQIVEQLRVTRIADQLVADPSADAAAMAARLDETLTRLAPGQDDVRMLAALEALPDHLRPDLPDPADQRLLLHHAQELEMRGADELDTDTTEMFARLRGFRMEQRILEPSLTREHATALLDGILAKPDAAIGVEELNQLALLRSLPKARRPEFPKVLERSLDEIAEWEYVPSEYTPGKVEIENLRRARIQQQLRAGGTFDKQAATARLDQLVDGPADEHTRRELLALLTLPTADRPSVPRSAMESVRAALDDDDYSAEAFDAVRSAVLTKRIKDPSTSVSDLEAIAARIGLKDVEHVTQRDLEHLDRLARLPEGRRPSFPEGTEYTWRDLASNGWLPYGDADAADMHRALQAWARTESTVGRAQIRSGLASGAIERPVLTELTRKSVAAKSGVSDEDLLRAWVHKAAEAGELGTETAHDDLLQVRKVLRRFEETDPTLQDLLKDAKRLTRRNLQRLDYERQDGYDNHPEYAELGRLKAQAELYASLRQMRSAPAGPRDAAAAASGVTRPASDLVMPTPVTETPVVETPTAAPEGAAVPGETLSW